MPVKAMRAVLYRRISVSLDTSVSLEGQAKELYALCEREGWQVVADLADDGLSGGKERENATTALRMLAHDQADIIVCLKLDRWTRQGVSAMAKLIDVLDAREKSGKPALFVAAAEGIRSDQPGWRITATVIAEVARAEREAISDRVSRAQRVMKANGRFRGGTTPYGYRSAPHPDGSGRTLVPDENESPIVREALARVLAGESVYAIAADFNERGVPTRRRSTKRRKDGQSVPVTWSTTTVAAMLTGPSVLGYQTLKGQLIRDAQGFPEVHWQPIVTEQEHARVTGLLSPRRKQGRRERRARLLSGLAHCGECGATMYVRTPHRDHPERQIYRCPARSNGRGCSSPLVAALPLEEHVTEAFLSAYRDWPILEREVIDLDADRRATVERVIRDTTDALNATDDDVEAERLTERLRKLRAERRALKAAINTEARWVETGETFGQVWERSDLAGKQRLLAEVIRTVLVDANPKPRSTFNHDRVRIQFRPVPTVWPDTESTGRMVPRDDASSWPQEEIDAERRNWASLRGLPG